MMRDAQGASEAHNLDQDGATPSPATGGFAELMRLETWMRVRGVRRARVGDLELELGELPTAPHEPKPETDEEAERRRRNALREDLNIRYAHTGGWAGPDEELDRMLVGRR